MRAQLSTPAYWTLRLTLVNMMIMRLVRFPNSPGSCVLTSPSYGNMQIYFVGGIHGSGKTTLCQVLSVSLGIRHVSAGELIRSGRNALPSSVKLVEDVDENQAILLRGLEELNGTLASIILDGHYTLLDIRGTIRRIDTGVFRRLAPKALLITSADPMVVAERLRARDGVSYDTDLLSEQGEAELAHAKLVSDELAVPLFVADAQSQVEGAIRFLATLHTPQGDQ